MSGAGWRGILGDGGRSLEQTGVGSARSQLTGIGLVLLSAFAFGLMPVLAKLTYQAGVNPVTLLEIRFGVASVMLWGWFALRARGPGVRRRRGLWLLGLGVVFTGTAISAFWSYDLLPVGTANLLLYLYPAVVVLLNGLLGERVTVIRWGTVGVAIAGCWLTAGASAAGLDALGVGLAIVSAIIYAVYIVLSTRAIGGVPALDGTALILTGAAITVGLIGASTGSLQLELSAEAWKWALLTSLVSSALAMGAFLAGAKRLGSSRAVLIATVEPVITVVAGFLVLGEVMAPLQALGAVLILAAVIATQQEPAKPTAA